MANVIHCTRCNSVRVNRIGLVPTLQGLKQRYRCINGHTFYVKKDRYES